MPRTKHVPSVVCAMVRLALGFGQAPGLRTFLWSTSLAVMGGACLFNSSRCGRVHCRFTGPFFILCAVISLGRLDRPGGSGLAVEQSLVPWAFVGFLSCFSVGIGEKGPQPNQPMKPTAHCDATSACLPRHRAVTYLFLARCCWIHAGSLVDQRHYNVAMSRTSRAQPQDSVKPAPPWP